MTQLASALEEHRDDILRKWTEGVRQHMAPGGESRAELEDHIPQFLRQLVAFLRGEIPKDLTSPEEGTNPVGREHGAQRFRLGFSLGELVREYGLLRDLLFDLIEDKGLHVTLGEVRLLTNFVATAIAEAVEEHARQQECARREHLDARERLHEEVRRSEAEREALLQETQRLRSMAEGERARLNALFEQAPACIGVIRGPEIVVEIANPYLCRIWGRTSEQVVGKPLLQALPELRGHGFDDLLRGVMATGEPFVATEMAVQFARGPGGALETGYFNFVYCALRDERGGIEGVLIIATEVTEAVLARQQVETLLKRSQEAERARTAVLEALDAQTLVAVCYLRGPDFVFEAANSIYRQLVGRDVVGLSSREAFPELVGKVLPNNLARVFETGEPFLVREAQVSVAQSLGGPLRERLFDFTYQPVRSMDGGVEGVLALIFEVTDQVLLRREAERLAGEERERRDFEQHLIGIVSHDLRNPLGVILLGLQALMRRGGLDARALQTLVRLRSSTERAVRMVRDLLDFTQARLGGGLKVARAPMDLHAVVRGVVDELQVTHPERELRLEQGGEGRGVWDADRIAQVLSNLVSNALKYSPADSAVTVRSEGGPEEARLEVHNVGEPIPAESLPRLFQPLQRAVEGTDKTGRSVGLGLYIVDQIVRAHGGHVEVSSSAPEGTRFTVHLPHES